MIANTLLIAPLPSAASALDTTSGPAAATPVCSADMLRGLARLRGSRDSRHGTQQLLHRRYVLEFGSDEHWPSYA